MTAQLIDLSSHRATRIRRSRGQTGEEAWVKPERVCAQHDISLRTLRRWRKQGRYKGCPPLEDFPGAVRFLSRSVVQYRLSRVEAWIAATDPNDASAT